MHWDTALQDRCVFLDVLNRDPAMLEQGAFGSRFVLGYEFLLMRSVMLFDAGNPCWNLEVLVLGNGFSFFNCEAGSMWDECCGIFMDLFFREFGEEGKPVVVVLHGLLGSSRNWQAAAQALSEKHHVYCLDLRNHGASPWAEPHTYELMMEDVMAWMDENLDSRPILVGHSMGGKLAMKLACEYPKAIRKLVVVDILPLRYPNNHDDDFAGMQAVNMDSLKSRTDAEAQLEPHVSSWAMRKFLLTNLEKDSITGEFRWMVNVDAIVESQRDIEANPLESGDSYDGDTLFIMGGKSRYFVREEVSTLRAYFPSSALEVIPESGHNPHFECRERFVEILSEFVG